MNTESILRCDVLDIIFENRNKEYGAYELRTGYRKRFSKALLVTIAAMVTFFAIIMVDRHFDRRNKIFLSLENPSDVILAPTNEEKHVLPLKPKGFSHEKLMAAIRDFPPRIVKLTDKTKPMPGVEELLTKAIGSQDAMGEQVGNASPVQSEGGAAEIATKIDDAIPAKIYDTAEKMPEFPGGMTALMRFLANNMRVPSEVEPGAKIKVLSKFVVDENRNITAIQTIISGGTIFDKEVQRVLRKMPQWKPGRQNGRNVSVYFALPVIFQGQSEDQ